MMRDLTRQEFVAILPVRCSQGSRTRPDAYRTEKRDTCLRSSRFSFEENVCRLETLRVLREWCPQLLPVTTLLYLRRICTIAALVSAIFLAPRVAAHFVSSSPIYHPSPSFFTVPFLQSTLVPSPDLSFSFLRNFDYTLNTLYTAVNYRGSFFPFFFLSIVLSE